MTHHSQSAEAIVLSTLFNNPNLFPRVLDAIDGKDFYNPTNQEIFFAMELLYHRHIPIDINTLSEQLKDIPQAELLMAVSDYEASPDSLLRYLFLIKEKSTIRGLTVKVKELHDTLELEVDYDKKLDLFEQVVRQMATRQHKHKIISDIVKEAFNTMQQRSQGIGVVKTGFQDIDRETNGLLPGQLIVFGARPGIGKTSFALSMAHNMMGLGKKVAFLSLEMAATELALKSLSIESQIPFENIQRWHCTSEDFMSVSKAASLLSEWPYILEDQLFSLTKIRSFARDLKNNNKVDVLFIDYLGLIEASRFRENKNLEVSDTCRALKMLAKELSIPIVVLAQLNRAVEDRTNKRPLLSDLRDSGAIEQDADIVGFLYRDYYYDPEEASPYDAEINIAKHRLGRTGTIYLTYKPHLMHFTDKE